MVSISWTERTLSYKHTNGLVSSAPKSHGSQLTPDSVTNPWLLTCVVCELQLSFLSSVRFLFSHVMCFDHALVLPAPSESFLPPYAGLTLTGDCGSQRSSSANPPLLSLSHPLRLSATSSSGWTEWRSSTAEGMLPGKCKCSPCWVLARVRGNEWGQSELLPLCPHRKRGKWYVSSVMITHRSCWKQNTQDSEEWPPFSRNTHSTSETSDLHKISSWFALIPALCETLWII